MSASPAEMGNLVVAGASRIALLFGLVAARTNFCTMGALSDIVNMGHWGRMRMWLLAVAVAMAGATALRYGGQIDLAKAVAMRPSLPWLSLLVGGLIFGVGMTLAGGCANKNLLRLGGGSLRSLVVLVFMGIAAYMTLKGLFGQWRASWLDPVRIDLGRTGWTDQGLATALSGGRARCPAGAAGVAAVSCWRCWPSSSRTQRFRPTVPGAGRGGAGPAGRGRLVRQRPPGLRREPGDAGVGVLRHQHPHDRVAEPGGARGLQLELLMLWTDKSLHLSFGIACAARRGGGSLLYALVARKFRWEGFASLADLRNQLVGRRADGLRRRHGAGLHHRPGLDRPVDAGHRLVHGRGRHRRSVVTLRVMLWQAERS
jgi:uncharacterized membrane protein YedE/YeeE